jgi:hypothetical protein
VHRKAGDRWRGRWPRSCPACGGRNARSSRNDERTKLPPRPAVLRRLFCLMAFFLADEGSYGDAVLRGVAGVWVVGRGRISCSQVPDHTQGCHTREGGYPVRRGLSVQPLAPLGYWITRPSAQLRTRRVMTTYICPGAERQNDRPNTFAPEGASRCRALASGLKGRAAGRKERLSEKCGG